MNNLKFKTYKKKQLIDNVNKLKKDLELLNQQKDSKNLDIKFKQLEIKLQINTLENILSIISYLNESNKTKEMICE